MKYYVVKVGFCPDPNKESWEENWDLLARCADPSHPHGKVDWGKSPQFCGTFVTKKSFRTEDEARTQHEALSMNWFSPKQAAAYIFTDEVLEQFKKRLEEAKEKQRMGKSVKITAKGSIVGETTLGVADNARPRTLTAEKVPHVMKKHSVKVLKLKPDPDCQKCGGTGNCSPHPKTEVPCGCLSTNR